MSLFAWAACWSPLRSPKCQPSPEATPLPAQRILDSAAQRLGVAPERVISNLANYGNTSAASIPLALDEAVRSGTIVPGSTVRPSLWSQLVLGFTG